MLSPETTVQQEGSGKGCSGQCRCCGGACLLHEATDLQWSRVRLVNGLVEPEITTQHRPLFHRRYFLVLNSRRSEGHQGC